MFGKTNSQNIITSTEPEPIPPACQIRFTNNSWNGSTVQFIDSYNTNDVANGASCISELNDASPFMIVIDVAVHRYNLYVIDPINQIQDPIASTDLTTDTMLYKAFMVDRMYMYNDPEIGNVVDIVGA